MKHLLAAALIATALASPVRGEIISVACEMLPNEETNTFFVWQTTFILDTDAETVSWPDDQPVSDDNSEFMNFIWHSDFIAWQSVRERLGMVTSFYLHRKSLEMQQSVYFASQPDRAEFANLQCARPI